MKKRFMKVLASSIVVIAFIPPLCAKNDKTSQTFFMPRTSTENGVLEMALNGFELTHAQYKHDQAEYVRPKNRPMVYFQDIYYMEQSRNDEDLAKYFLLGNKTELNVLQSGGGDIYSGWLGLYGSTGHYDKMFSIRPKRKIFGATINYHQDLSPMVNNLWFAAFLPVVKAEHYLKLIEYKQGEAAVESIGTPLSFNQPNPNPASARFTDIRSALNNMYWKYGKFSTSKMHLVSLDDLQLKLGYNILTNYKKYHWGVYGDLLIALGDAPKADYLFESMVGNGGHTGLGIGTNFDCSIFTGKKRNIFLYGDLKYRYLFSSTEKRSFDLVNNGNWSRYMWVVKNDGLGTLDYGINNFTRDLKVKPKSQFEGLLALHGKFSDFNVELGYNLWAKQAEKVSLKQAWNAETENIGLPAYTAGGVLQTAVTGSAGKIANNVRDSRQVASDSSFVRIQASDLNLASAAHQSVLAQKFYAGVGLNYRFFKRPCMIGVTGSYEFGSSNTALDQWGIMLNTNFSF
ncbi:TPA: hypothetical protein DEO28_05230 [Candidatus Dependentiae bacterium]|nr:MAG: hypothetical protein UR14_C0002G0157 [candidate division TM6 bacterium GW2011_GWE2_31_21]KKP53954.1 MAG: hypothetical protein UR43_C0002G0157 [candidate division TM6 bacterium GW2011_GWF2_33_332]HBS47734.1 hypothetical protein [Candidatus Dependentiae bacterium]HBZ73883.1 hypothetical protein [Candidatus Dependentiae bacterium]